MPSVIGGRALRILTLLLIVVALLFAATVMLLEASGVVAISRSFLVHLEGGLWSAFVLFSVMLAIAPALAFLIHSVRHRDEQVTQRLRYAATASAVAPGLFGLPLILWGGSAQVVGWILMCVTAAVIVRAWTARGADTSANAPVVGYKYSLAGIVALVVLVPVTAGPLGRSHKHSFRAYYKSDSYIYAMKFDLRDLDSAQRSYFEDHKRYSSDVVELGFKPTTGVVEPKVIVGPGWWSATNTHSQLSNRTCGIAVNAVNPVVATAREGEVACK